MKLMKHRIFSSMTKAVYVSQRVIHNDAPDTRGSGTRDFESATPSVCEKLTAICSSAEIVGWG